MHPLTWQDWRSNQDGGISTWTYGHVVSKMKAAHKGGVTQVFWTSDQLLSGGVDCCLKIWWRHGKYLNPKAVRTLDLKHFSVSKRSFIASSLIPKSLDVFDDGKILLGTASSQIFVLPPSKEWETDANGRVDPAKCGKLLLTSHYRRAENDSLHGITTYPLRAFIPGQENCVVSTKGHEKIYNFATCGPDDTIRFWSMQTRELMTTISGEFIRPLDGVVFPCSPCVLDLSPNGKMLAVGFKNGSWALYIDIGKTKQWEWKKVFMTDISKRITAQERMVTLKKELAKASDAARDPYRAVFSGDRDRYQGQIDELKKEIDAIQDYSRNGEITVVKFSPSGVWVVVGSRDSFMDIFSVKDLEIKSKDGVWRPMCDLDLDHQHIASDACVEQESTDPDLDLQQRFEREYKRGVIQGELNLKGVRGIVKRVGSCKGHGSGVTRCDWSLDCRMLRSTSDTGELLFWDAPRGRHNSMSEQHRDLEWATHTALFGCFSHSYLEDVVLV